MPKTGIRDARRVLEGLQLDPLYQMMSTSQPAGSALQSFCSDFEDLVTRCFEDPPNEVAPSEIRPKLQHLLSACTGKAAPFAKYFKRALEALPNG